MLSEVPQRIECRMSHESKDWRRQRGCDEAQLEGRVDLAHGGWLDLGCRRPDVKVFLEGELKLKHEKTLREKGLTWIVEHSSSSSMTKTMRSLQHV